jgi:hypothetical protein
VPYNQSKTALRAHPENDRREKATAETGYKSHYFQIIINWSVAGLQHRSPDAPTPDGGNPAVQGAGTCAIPVNPYIGNHKN